MEKVLFLPLTAMFQGNQNHPGIIPIHLRKHQDKTGAKRFLEQFPL